MRIDGNLSDEAVLEELGRRLRKSRLAANLTQEQVAEEAGISMPTINKLEHGKPVQILTLIRVLRVLGQLDGLEAALPEPEPRPIDLFRRRGRERQRASRRHEEAPPDSAQAFRWGDEREERR